MDFGTVLTVYLVFFVLSLVSMIFYMDFGTVLTVYLVFFVLSLVSMIFYMDFGSVLTGVPHFQFFATRIIKVKIYTKF
jgi:peptidoglycan/LPS O-acetylase OafA/YrhL